MRLFLCLLLATYIFLEVWFVTASINILSITTFISEIKYIEKAGLIITSFGVALSIIVKKHLSTRAGRLNLLVTFAVLFFLTFSFLEIILEYIESSATYQDKFCSSVGVAAKQDFIRSSSSSINSWGNESSFISLSETQLGLLLLPSAVCKSPEIYQSIVQDKDILGKLTYKLNLQAKMMEQLDLKGNFTHVNFKSELSRTYGVLVKASEDGTLERAIILYRKSPRKLRKKVTKEQFSLVQYIVLNKLDAPLSPLVNKPHTVLWDSKEGLKYLIIDRYLQKYMNSLLLSVEKSFVKNVKRDIRETEKATFYLDMSKFAVRYYPLTDKGREYLSTLTEMGKDKYDFSKEIYDLAGAISKHVYMNKLDKNIGEWLHTSIYDALTLLEQEGVNKLNNANKSIKIGTDDAEDFSFILIDGANKMRLIPYITIPLSSLYIAINLSLLFLLIFSGRSREKKPNTTFFILCLFIGISIYMFQNDFEDELKNLPIPKENQGDLVDKFLNFGVLSQIYIYPKSKDFFINAGIPLSFDRPWLKGDTKEAKDYQLEMTRIEKEFHNALSQKHLLTPINKSALWFAEVMYSNNLLTDEHVTMLLKASSIYEPYSVKADYLNDWAKTRCSVCTRL
tara:strand:- start:25488 stop:27353 length:1866 start_codon:yes stop_codon:yes gene_type:complete